MASLFAQHTQAPPPASQKQVEKSPQEEEPPPSLARQNPILRSYFRREYMAVHSVQERREMPPPSFIDNFVDRRIDTFVERVEKKIGEVREGIDQVSQDRLAALQHREGNRLSLAASLEELADNSDELRRMLSFIFTGLKAKAPEREIIDSPDNILFEREIALIEKDLTWALQRVEAFLFTGSPVVSVQDLNSNMLATLHSSSRLARQLGKKL